MPQRVIVTGASTGIGQGIALDFLKQGDIVVLSSRTVAKLADEQTAFSSYVNSRKAFLIPADLGREGEVRQLIAEAEKLLEGQIDVLVNNAGIYDKASLAEITHEHWHKTMSLNLESYLWASQAAAPALARSRGCIINISSDAALRPSDAHIAYSVSKAAIDMLTRNVAKELAPQGVRVNAVNPGFVQTPILEAAGMSAAQARALFNSAAEFNPLGRVGQVSDIAPLVLFLADGAKAGYITGQCIVVDGGQRSFATH